MPTSDLLLFALGASRTFGQRVADRLGIPLADHEEREFEDGQHKARSLVNVRGRDVFVLHGLHGDDEQSVNDKLCRLLFFLGSIRDASAATVTAVVPFLCYSRKDRKTKPRDPVTTRYVAALFEAVGVDRVVTLDVHNPAAFQNAFRCRTEHLEARKLFVEYLASALGEDPVAVVSPDVGGTKRADGLRQSLASRLGRLVSGAHVEKYRSQDVVSGEALVGDVAGRTAFLFDDMISSGGTVARAAGACRAGGARRVWVGASHGVFTPEARDALVDDAIDRVVTLDTIPPDRLGTGTARSKLVQLDATKLFADAIRAMHVGGSVVELLEP
jgi:ribose-phosphate pyrophosphokinase